MDLAKLGEHTAVSAILLALATNALFKTSLCGLIAGPRLAWRVGLPLLTALSAGFVMGLSDIDWQHWSALWLEWVEVPTAVPAADDDQ
jgi:hypothetical protein